MMRSDRLHNLFLSMLLFSFCLGAVQADEALSLAQDKGGESPVSQPVAPVIHLDQIRDPFDSYLIPIVTSQDEHQQQLTLVTEDNRPLEELEAFDLTALTLVGVMSAEGGYVAMVEDVMGKSYLVHEGDHIGKHYGQVKRISEQGLMLNEIYVDEEGKRVIKEINMGFNALAAP
ncbi:MAG: pilus assembly protein PilP [Zetaproteobacteria bacterium]|nr:pilus assembly protein PilP [Zetaproteobacteria bacterium]